MLQGLLSQARALFFRLESPKPTWNDSAHLDALWNEKKSMQVERRLGTTHEAIQTLDEYQDVFADNMEYIRGPFSGRNFCRDTDGLRDKLEGRNPDEIVGDTNDVSHLFGKCLRIGYVIEKDSASGLQKEVIESIDRRLTVLRRNGCIISAYPCTIIRMESRGGIHII